MISAFFRMALALCLILMSAAAAHAQPSGVKTVGLIAAMSDTLTVTTLGKNANSTFTQVGSTIGTTAS